MLCGLEIHQRIGKRKLFSYCPNPLAQAELEKNSFKFFRRLYPTKSEIGQLDNAAFFESQKEKTFFYYAPFSFTSLVETDEEPPYSINPEALLYALSFSKFINANIVDELHVMRKIVIDGSNVSGFQRTALVAFDGVFASPKMKIPIQTVCLEEEAAGIIESSSSYTSYRLDRLGIPLLEIATEPVFRSATEAKEAALEIGLALRMHQDTARGLGTIRQDVNISVDGGARVEIKGLQNIELLELLIQNEEQRQKKLIEIINQIKSLNIDFSQIKAINVSDLFRSSKCKIISNVIRDGGEVYCIYLPSFKGILGKELYKNRRFGTELSDYVKASTSLKGLIHSDENLANYGFAQEEIKALADFIGLKENDAFILLSAKKQELELASKIVIERIKMLYVPKETRKANEDGSSSFLRPLGSAARLYPETDIPIIALSNFPIKENGSFSYYEKLEKYKKELGNDLAIQILSSHNLFLFEEIIKKVNAPKQAAIILENYIPKLRRENLNTNKITPKIIIDILEFYSQDKISSAAIEEILRLFLTTNLDSVEQIIKTYKLFKLSKKQTLELFEKEGKNFKEFIKKYRLIADMSVFEKPNKQD
jgi:glutamyl-tRNA(Gln) amidotransferase subunit E